MISSQRRPLLFLDVDGPLIPFGAPPQELPDGYPTYPAGPAMGEAAEPSDADERGGLHWKTRTLVAHAAGRAIAWVDDEITEADRAWTAAHHPGRTLLHRVAARAVTAVRCHAVAVQ
ncbi:hypothetical protein [Streptomyces sp. KL118A]|uniref:hypothetical protein n=1 Tax=Streptomyces sp. KL118A TaxID=3045153 RepID=UPI00278C5889|nr:hypothetical protein [Streptomyces sp. KL118A]